jgi:foldase protein PrsA
MFRRSPIVFVLIAAALLALTLGACGGKEEVKLPPDTVATVQGKPITNQEFNHWLAVVNASQAGTKPNKNAKLPKPGSTQYKQLVRQVMQFLVTSRWILGEAADRKLNATNPEIAKQFKLTKQQSFPNDKAYRKFLRTSGQTQSDIDFRVKADLLANKVRQDVTKEVGTVSDDDIKSYYSANQQQFSQPERRDLQVVVNKDQSKAQEALAKIKGGEDFKTAVKQYSTDPATKQQNGQLLGVAKGQQDPALDDAVFKASQGQPEGPVKTPQGYYVFQVTKVTPASKQSLDQAKEGIRQLLISQKQQQALDGFTQDFRSKWRGRTDCQKTYVTPDCSNGKEEPSTAAGVGPPAKQGQGGNPPALGGAQAAAPISAGVPGAGTGALPTPTPGTGPPATSGVGAPAALGGAPQNIPQNVPGQNAPPAGASPQG